MGQGISTAGAVFTINHDAATLAPGDLNNDGKVDLVVAGAGPENTTGNFVQTFLGDGTGNFTLKETTLLGHGNIERVDRLGGFQ